MKMINTRNEIINIFTTGLMVYISLRDIITGKNTQWWFVGLMFLSVLLFGFSIYFYIKQYKKVQRAKEFRAKEEAEYKERFKDYIPKEQPYKKPVEFVLDPEAMFFDNPENIGDVIIGDKIHSLSMSVVRARGTSENRQNRLKTLRSYSTELITKDEWIKKYTTK